MTSRTATIRAALAGSEAIVHLAALSDASQSLADPVGYTTINALGTLNVLEAARQHGAGVVFASSQRIYEPWHGPLHEDAPKAPTTVYGWSKLAAEGWVTMYSQVYNVPTITLRLFSVYGPGQRMRGGASGVLAIFAERTLRGQRTDHSSAPPARLRLGGRHGHRLPARGRAPGRPADARPRL